MARIIPYEQLMEMSPDVNLDKTIENVNKSIVDNYKKGERYVEVSIPSRYFDNICSQLTKAGYILACSGTTIIVHFCG